VTEAQARDQLRRCDGQGGIEAWIAGRRWKAEGQGWTVAGDLQRWRFRVEPVLGGVRISATMPGALPAVWVVTD
jgi:hypothetical protein